MIDCLPVLGKFFLRSHLILDTVLYILVVVPLNKRQIVGGCLVRRILIDQITGLEKFKLYAFFVAHLEVLIDYLPLRWRFCLSFYL